MTDAKYGRCAAIFGCAGAVLSAKEKALFAKADPFGFILFDRNIKTADQIRDLCTDLRDSVGWYVPIFIDQEGGRVQRLCAPLVKEWPTPLEHVDMTGESAEQAIFARYFMIAQELRDLGITANCAPVADIARPQTHKILKNRCFGRDAMTVSRLARVAANGLLAGGVLPVIKHIPGHGLAQVDSHKETPVVTEAKEVLAASDFVPFKALNDLPIAMTAHVIYRKIDAKPGSVSEKIIGLIRNDIGFDGLLMSDDLSMQALSGTVVKRAKAVIDVGCDLVLHCNGELDEMRNITASTGKMSAMAQLRGDKVIALHNSLSSIKVDLVQARAQLETL
jgi:beta-N-acetylhexosaminidase